MKKYQNGFGVIEAIVIIVILIILGGLGYVIWHNMATTKAKTSPTSTTTSSSAATINVQVLKVPEYSIQFTIASSAPTISYKINKSSGSNDLQLLANKSIGSDYACQDRTTGYFVSLVNTTKEQIQSLGDDPSSTNYTKIGDTYWTYGLLGPCKDNTVNELIKSIVHSIKPLS